MADTETTGMVEVLGKGASAPLLKQELDSVTIIGMGPTCQLATIPLMTDQIPFDDRNQVWAINAAAKVFPHNLAWNVHDLNVLRNVEKKADELINWYSKEYKRPVVTLRSVPEMSTLIYPIKQVVEHWQDDYFFAAPSYMLAYAVMCGAKHIRLFGLDFDYPDRTEYEAGRCCTEYWCGRVRTLGVKFFLPTQTSLFDYHWRDRGGRIGYGSPLYGYFDRQPPITLNDDGDMIVDDSDVG